MTDLTFHHRAGPFKLAELASIGEAEIAPGTDGAFSASDIAPLDVATVNDLSFLENTAYLDAFTQSAAGACVVHPDFAKRAPKGMHLLLSTQPYRTYALIASAFYPRPAAQPAIAESAVIASDAVIGDGCEIAPGAVIEAGVVIGTGAIIGPGAIIGRNVRIGDDFHLGAQASLSHCIIGDRVTIHPGARIGQDGFGFAPGPAGHVKVPQIGRVVIGDDCDIGANTTIDRGSLRDTVIGQGCLIDNLVQIAHNVELGDGCIIAAMAGIAGSTKLGRLVAVGGQAGITGHAKIGDGVQLAARSGVISDVPAGVTYAGYPAMPIREHFRQVATLRRLAQHRGAKK